MSKNCIILGALILEYFLISISMGSEIKEINSEIKKINPIYVKVGRSTVIQFEKRPVKAVVGNQNYYSIEFVNNDVTIQPLANIPTNLFIYTETETYGFDLLPRSPPDQLVVVKRILKNDPKGLKVEEFPIKPWIYQAKSFSLRRTALRFEIKSERLNFVDFELKNLSTNFLVINDQKFSDYRVVVGNNNLKKGESTKLRIFYLGSSANALISIGKIKVQTPLR